MASPRASAEVTVFPAAMLPRLASKARSRSSPRSRRNPGALSQSFAGADGLCRDIARPFGRAASRENGRQGRYHACVAAGFARNVEDGGEAWESPPCWNSSPTPTRDSPTTSCKRNASASACRCRPTMSMPGMKNSCARKRRNTGSRYRLLCPSEFVVKTFVDQGTPREKLVTPHLRAR